MIRIQKSNNQHFVKPEISSSIFSLRSFISKHLKGKIILLKMIYEPNFIEITHYYRNKVSRTFIFEKLFRFKELKENQMKKWSVKAN